jgi:phosphate:Na+ symporter
MKEILIALSGVIFFLVGMIRLSSTVRKIINTRIKQYIKYAVAKPIYGLFTGLFSTVFFQSSSASTALTIGLVSAGLISFYSSLAIILGADIGTTLTVQFVVWKFTDISPLFISLGGLLWLTRRDKWKAAGEIIFYFGLIFFGLNLVGETAAQLKNSPAFLNLFAQTKNPVFGLGLGIVVTGIVHASAIPISILAMLAQQDLVSLENALPIIIGANIGTTITALLAGTVATVSGKRTAISHFIFKCIGAALFLIFLPHFLSLLKYLSSSTAQQIVFAHLLMNLLTVMAFIFFLQPFARLMNRILRGEDENLPLWPEFLDSKDLSDAEKALGDVQKELQREMSLVQKMYLSSIDLIACHKEGKKKDISYIEMVVNNLRSQIVKYLWKVSARQLSAKLSKKLFAYTAIADDIESVGNHIILITSLAAQKASKKIKFSESGERDLGEIIDLVKLNLQDAMSLIKMPSDDKIRSIIRQEEEVDIKVKDARERHLKRFHNRLCRAEAGPVFVEMLIHLERISDHCNNIAEYILSLAAKHDFEKYGHK